MAEPTFVITGGTVMDATGERRADVLVYDGFIREVAEGIDVPLGATVLDAGGCVIAPGLVDLHTHLREPGRGRRRRWRPVPAPPPSVATPRWWPCPTPTHRWIRRPPFARCSSWV